MHGRSLSTKILISFCFRSSHKSPRASIRMMPTAASAIPSTVIRTLFILSCEVLKMLPVSESENRIIAQPKLGKKNASVFHFEKHFPQNQLSPLNSNMIAIPERKMMAATLSGTHLSN